MLSNQEILKLINDDKEKLELFNKKIQQIASELKLELSFFDSSSELISQPNTEEKYNSESNREEENNQEQANYFKKKPKHHCKLECDDGSSFYLDISETGGARLISDHWTEESIDAAAKMAAKMGGEWRMIPSGQPAAFPDHLRAYAIEAWAKQGMHISDPTPPTQERIDASRKRYEALEAKGTKQQATKQFKANLTELKSRAEDSKDKEDKAQSTIPMTPTPTPFNLKPKQW